MSKRVTGTYSPTVKCGNCGYTDRCSMSKVQIPQGKLVKDHPCPSCGCKTLVKAGAW